MKAIVNVNENWGIGREGGLLAFIPEDMRFFRAATLGKVVVMGRKTLESFPGGRPLKDRVNVVLTRDASRIQAVSEPGRELVIADSLERLAEVLSPYASEDVYVIGGEAVYRQLLPFCKSCLVTKNDLQAPADAWFPDLDRLPGWRCAEEGEPKEHEGIHYRFTVYLNDCPRQLGGR